MLSNHLANKLLYVPFFEEYPAPPELKDALTTDEFFNECYYHPDFDQEIERLDNLSDEELDDLDYPLSKLQMVDLLQQQQSNEKTLIEWIEGSGTGIYCITGDAGTGKSTYLHHLQNDNKAYCWDFLDLQRAVYEHRIMGMCIQIPDFTSLRGKIISTMLRTIINGVFVQFRNKPNYRYDDITTRINDFCRFYKNTLEEFYPAEAVAELYTSLEDIPEETGQIFCNKCAKRFVDYFNILFNKYDSEQVFRYVFEHFLIYLYFSNSYKKHIIVIDNLERYIGTDEIFNDQIINLFAQLRACRDQYNQQFGAYNDGVDQFPRHFQIIVAMRNTTVRMFTPQQYADFVAHGLDLSEWFPIGEIIKKKFAWFEKHSELLGDCTNTLKTTLLYILGDQGQTGDILRGLRLKLNMLFNNDKRLICDFLISALNDRNNKAYLEAANHYLDDPNLSPSLRKFAYRSIIWRIVINKLGQGTLFQMIYQLESFERIIAELDYVRKILTILSNYSFAHPHGFMSLFDLLRDLYPKRPQVEFWFYSGACKFEKSKVSRILYLLNSYDRRENDWFKFIDIQCNSEHINGTHIKDLETFEAKMLDRNTARHIRIQITAAGKAYLGYIVQSFEFASRLSGCIDPLPFLMPSADEIENSTSIENIPCINTIQRVFANSKRLIQLSRDDSTKGYEVPYRKSTSDSGSYYSYRIVHAHSGYINNFRELVEKVLQSENEKVCGKREKLIEELNTLSLKYSVF